MKPLLVAAIDICPSPTEVRDFIAPYTYIVLSCFS